MIKLTNVSKSYKLKNGRIVILDDVTHTFHEGQNIGIIGANGAGKSTTMRIISGSESPTQGRVKRNARISWPLGFASGFNSSLTGEENLRFISRIYGQDIRRVREYVKDFSELGEFLYEPVRNYSSGMKSRLAFSLSMAISFEFYLIDEITGVGDASFQEKCHHAFEEKRNQATLLMISHSMETIRSYCESIIVLNDGKFNYFDKLDDGIEFHSKLQQL